MSAPAGAVDVAHSRALGVGGNRGIMRKSTISSGHGLAPMCAVPLTAHGSPTTTHHAHRKMSFQQKPVTAPSRLRSPMCITDDNHTHRTPPRMLGCREQAATSPHPVRYSQTPPQTHCPPYSAPRSVQGPISSRSTTDLGAEADRFRHGGGGAGRLTWAGSIRPAIPARR